MRNVIVGFIQVLYDEKSPVWALICIFTLTFSVFMCRAWCIVHPRCSITRYVYYSSIATTTVLFIDFLAYLAFARFASELAYRQLYSLTTLRYFMWETNFTITMLLPTYKFYRQLQHIHMIDLD